MLFRSDSDDSAIVYIYVNGVVNSRTTFVGNNSNSVFSTTPTVMVPSGGTYQIVIYLVTNLSNEFWTIKNGDVSTCLKVVQPLPVTLIDFNATSTDEKSVMLTWKTASEVMNNYFTVEHSSDGKEFDPLAKFAGAGTTSAMNEYRFSDENAFSGMNYYRLSQTDFDGKTQQCGIVSVKVGEGGVSKNHLEIY